MQFAHNFFVAPSVNDLSEPALFAYRRPNMDLFLLGSGISVAGDELITTSSIEKLIKIDPSLTEILSLPAGHRATRKTRYDPWKIAQVDFNTGRGEYFDGYLQWINKMYVDGYYTGGVVPHWYVSPGKPKLFGWVSLCISIILLGFSFYLLIRAESSTLKALLPIFITGGFFLFIGLRIVLKRKQDI